MSIQQLEPELPISAPDSQPPIPNVLSWFYDEPDGVGYQPQSQHELKHGIAVVICTYKRAASVAAFLRTLASQDRKPEQLIIVDASPDDETERTFRDRDDRNCLADSVSYFHVAEPRRGLTRQRNFALPLISTDLVAFFDDDVRLLPSCLAEMEKAHRENQNVVGVGAVVENDCAPPWLVWRLRRSLRIVPDLRPGSYCRSGMSIPWNFLPPGTDSIVEGDWLSGCAMMWKTAAVRETCFNEAFNGYASGEDLDFSLRMRPKGKLVVTGKAKVLHIHDENGRPDPLQLVYMRITNSYQIHRHCLPHRTRTDGVRFVYAYGMDTLLKCANLFRPGKQLETIIFLRGRLRFFWRLATMRA